MPEFHHEMLNTANCGNGRTAGRMNRHMKKPMRLAWLAVALLGAVPAHAAETQTFSGDYTVSFLGFTVARSNFSSRFDGTSFTVQGTVASAGFGRFFDDTDGTVSASGRFAGDRTQPNAFRVDYTQKKKPTIDHHRFQPRQGDPYGDDPAAQAEGTHLDSGRAGRSCRRQRSAVGNPGQGRWPRRRLQAHRARLRRRVPARPDAAPRFRRQRVDCRL